MDTGHSQQALSPVPIFNLFAAFQRTAVINTALELDVFTTIGAHGGATATEVAQERNTSKRGMRILLDYLTSAEMLKKSGDKYSLSPEAAFFLDRKSQAYLGSAIKFMYSSHLRAGFDSLTDAVRKGGTALPNKGATADEHPQWVEFAKSMAPMMFPASQAIAERVKARLPQGAKVLDVAAGHGLFGLAIAQHVPTAQITALDWAPVLAVAEENAKRFEVAGRFHKLPGDGFKIDYGTGYDAVLLTNILHHFNVAECTAMLRKVHGALKPGGIALILEFVPNEDRVTPPDPAMFSMIMLATTPEGEAFTFAEYQKMCTDAGFTKCEIQPLPPLPQSLIIAQK
jgi:ubiquinone/menaquinone biosynthesis C-methylase UbiE